MTERAVLAGSAIPAVGAQSRFGLSHRIPLFPIKNTMPLPPVHVGWVLHSLVVAMQPS